MELKKAKIAIVYHSESNNTKSIAEKIQSGIVSTEKAECTLFSVKDSDYESLMEMDCIIFGTPIYLANMSWQMKQWLDKSAKFNYEGKLAGVFATENHIGGGAETGLLSLINHLVAKGMLIYSGGFALGNPYIHLGPVAIKDGDEFQQERAVIFGKRMAEKAYQLFIK